MMDERKRTLIKSLWRKRNDQYDANLKNRALYEGEKLVSDLKTSVPPMFRDIPQVVGWIRIAIDRLSERVNFQGYDSSEHGDDLSALVESNDLLMDSHISNHDAFTYGFSYVMVTQGNTDIGEPPILVSVESPINCSANVSLRKRTATEVAHFIVEDELIIGTLFTEEEVIPFEASKDFISIRETAGGYEHGLGRPPVVVVINQRESGKARGRSEITNEMISVTDSTMRTMLGMEVAREFYSYPQKYILGADTTKNGFVDPAGNPISSTQLLMNNFLTVGRTGKNAEHLPQVGQFQANNPNAFTSLLDQYRSQFASYASVPLHYLGANTANPSSADAIRASDSILTKKAEIRISALKKYWREVAFLALRTAGVQDVDVSRIVPMYSPPETMTRGAVADEILKYVSAGILQPDSQVVFNRMNLSKNEIDIIKRENAYARNQQLVRDLSIGRNSQPGDTNG